MKEDYLKALSDVEDCMTSLKTLAKPEIPDKYWLVYVIAYLRERKRLE